MMSDSQDVDLLINRVRSLLKAQMQAASLVREITIDPNAPIYIRDLAAKAVLLLTKEAS